jgi:hypothetical protein
MLTEVEKTPVIQPAKKKEKTDVIHAIQQSTSIPFSSS